MRIRPAFDLADVELARSIARAHPFATIVTSQLRATHMPCLVEEDADGLVILGHVARADPAAASLAGPLLLIFQGPHGYVSASWYERDTIPTWNHVTLHVRGTPALLDDPMALLERTVDHFEAAVERPWSLRRMGDEAHTMAGDVIGFRLRAESWHAEAKLSQDKPDDERERVLAGLEAPGPYRNRPLAALMRRFSVARRGGDAKR